MKLKEEEDREVDVNEGEVTGSTSNSFNRKE